MSYDAILLLIILVAAIPANGFPLLYGIGAPWWRSDIGRALFLKSSGLAAFVDLSLLFLWLGEYPGRNELRVVVYTFVTVGLWYQFSVLVRTQYRGRTRK